MNLIPFVNEEANNHTTRHDRSIASASSEVSEEEASPSRRNSVVVTQSELKPWNWWIWVPWLLRSEFRSPFSVSSSVSSPRSLYHSLGESFRVDSVNTCMLQFQVLYSLTFRLDSPPTSTSLFRWRSVMLQWRFIDPSVESSLSSSVLLILLAGTKIWTFLCYETMLILNQSLI